MSEIAHEHGALGFEVATRTEDRNRLWTARDNTLYAGTGLRPGSPDNAPIIGTAGLPDPDLLIRTSGEMRVSNFLLWQIAYAEIWVTETLWPDFRRRDLLEAVVAYQKRDRRYGGIKPSPVALGAK